MAGRIHRPHALDGVDRLRARLDRLQEQMSSPGRPGGTRAEPLEELQAALEELEVADEELRPPERGAVESRATSSRPSAMRYRTSSTPRRTATWSPI